MRDVMWWIRTPEMLVHLVRHELKSDINPLIISKVKGVMKNKSSFYLRI